MTQFEDFLTAQNDEICNAAFELIKAMTRNPEIEWDMYYIGEVADVVAESLKKLGLEICYPFYTEGENENGEGGTPCYLDDECETADCLMRCIHATGQSAKEK